MRSRLRAASAFLGGALATIVYVDGFNLYYGCLKATSYRWLDLAALCQRLLPNDTIRRIHYFTARITPRFDDPGKPIRQNFYLRALGTLPLVTVTFGQYLTHEVSMALAGQPPTQPAQRVRVIKNEEKGSDVNHAAYLMLDACRGVFDTAVVISNDTDLLTPIRLVQREFHKPVGVFNPQRHPSHQLSQEAAFYKQIRAGVLAASQFPTTLTDSTGTFTKPLGW